MRYGKLPHPDAFTQVSTCCLYFSSHFSGILLSVWENQFLQKQIKRNSRFPICPLPRAALTAASHSSGSLRFPSDTGSRGAPPNDVSSVLALSFAALSIGGVWAMMLYGTRTTLPMYSPSCPSDWGRRVFYFTLGQSPAAVALMAHSSRSFDRWLLSHRRFFIAISAGSSAGGTSCTNAPLLALSTRPMMFPALWQVPWGSRSLWVTPKSRLNPQGSCSGGVCARAASGFCSPFRT